MFRMGWRFSLMTVPLVVPFLAAFASAQERSVAPERPIPAIVVDRIALVRAEARGTASGGTQLSVWRVDSHVGVGRALLAVFLSDRKQGLVPIAVLNAENADGLFFPIGIDQFAGMPLAFRAVLVSSDLELKYVGELESAATIAARSRNQK